MPASLGDAAFADIAAQTLVNALFAARVAHESSEPFALDQARTALPRHDALLRRVSAVMTSPRSRTGRLGAALAEVCDRLAAADVRGGDDPLLHFYERFLAAYDPALRGLRGVYVTPRPVVRYVVRAVLDTLHDAFGIAADAPAGGFTVLDPACGTGAFLNEFAIAVRARFIERDDPGGWRAYVRTVLLRRLAGFELLAVPYAVAHVKLALTLRGGDLGEPERSRYRYELGPHERLRISLANALLASAARDSHGVGDVLVVLGNPPYSGHSANAGAMGDLVRRAYAGGAREANAKWLHDDYVKFIRFAEDRVARAGRGVVAFVTNHAYLDNATFAGMRRHLMQTFDEISVLDLHGNAKIVETAPDGSRDENVFAIQAGTAIGIFVKRGRERNAHCTVRFAERYGDRRAKYDWLRTATPASTRWTPVTTSSASAPFRPARSGAPLGYADAPSLASVMPLRSLGVLTKRDALAVAFTQRELLERLAVFADAGRSDGEAAAAFGLPLHDNDRWSVADARRAAARADPANVRAIQYRCGDFRWYYDVRGVVARRNRRVLDHVGGGERVALLVGRQGGAATSGAWDSVWASAISSDQNLFRRGGATVFPVLLNGRGAHAEQPRWNVSDAFVDYAAARTGEPDRAAVRRSAAGYVYGLLNAPRFRAEFAAELKRDFPRIPVVDAGSFAALSAIGWDLLGLHVLADAEPAAASRACGVVGAGRFTLADVDAAGYGTVDVAGRRFERVHRHAWERTCGGSPVLESFLRARKGRELDADDVVGFTRLAMVFDQERRLLAQANEIFEALLRFADVRGVS